MKKKKHISNINVLIVTPELSRLGGVANHYKGLFPYFTENVNYIFYGKRKKVPAFILFPLDILHFIFKLFSKRVDVVVINPSLRPYQIFRDSIYLLIATFFKRKVVTFIHGWDDNFFNKIRNKPKFFRYVLNKSLFIYVLHSKFKIELESINISTRIILTTTKISDSYLDNFDLSSKASNINNILFLSRIEKYKGIYETLEIFQKLLIENGSLHLMIVGDGDELKNIKLHVQKLRIQNVTFYGSLEGNDLIKCFQNADVFLFPSYAEGMPTVVLEAMAFGLPIFTTRVGGLNDFFENTKMGYFIDVNNLDEVVELMIKLINDEGKVKEINIYNHEFAKTHFLASKVAQRIMQDINNEYGKN